MTLLTGRADLHMHTTASDGTATPAELLDYVALHRPDLDVIAITDHDVLDSSLWAAEQNGRYPFEIVPGMEVTTRDGHVLAWWVHEPVPAGLSLAETTAAIHAQGGIAVLAHPFEVLIAPHTFMRYLLRPDVLITSGIDAVEVFNAGAFTPGGSWLARLRYDRFLLPAVGNSDAHMPHLVGTGCTHFRGHTAADLRASIEAGETAAEGRKWDMSAYLHIWRAMRRMKSNAASAKRSPAMDSPAPHSTALPLA
jgi:predicted metal-dependent phosphoesterase TrpH